MLSIKQQFITDNNGHKIGVLLPINEYNKILKELEEIEDIKAFDLAKAKNETTIPLRDSIKIRRKKNG
jgi:hypothetical protein